MAHRVSSHAPDNAAATTSLAASLTTAQLTAEKVQACTGARSLDTAHLYSAAQAGSREELIRTDTVPIDGAIVLPQRVVTMLIAHYLPGWKDVLPDSIPRDVIEAVDAHCCADSLHHTSPHCHLQQ